MEYVPVLMTHASSSGHRNRVLEAPRSSSTQICYLINVEYTAFSRFNRQRLLMFETRENELANGVSRRRSFSLKCVKECIRKQHEIALNSERDSGIYRKGGRFR